MRINKMHGNEIKPISTIMRQCVIQLIIINIQQLRTKDILVNCHRHFLSRLSFVCLLTAHCSLLNHGPRKGDHYHALTACSNADRKVEGFSPTYQKNLAILV